MISIAKPDIGPAEQAAVQEVLESGHIAAGPRVAAFEQAFAEFCGTEHAVATSNGTTALHAALEALGVGPGDEVVVPAFTFIATANAVLYAGAKPVLADVDPETFTLDSVQLERVVSEKTKAIVPVHLYGQCADMEAIMRFAKDNGIKVLGDAAQAHGAESLGRRAGGLGHAETFSMYPTKNMTSGEGGMITTDDAEVANAARSIVNHGRAQSTLGTYDHLRRGHNFRLTDVHAAIGLVQLERLPGFNERRREIARTYDKAFAKLRTIRSPAVGVGNLHVYHQYTLVCKNRAAVVDHLKRHDIGVGVYYPRPLHGYPHLSELAHSRLEVSNRLAGQVVSIPVHPGLSDQDVDAVIQRVIEADDQVGRDEDSD